MSQKNKKLDNPELLPPQGLSRYRNIMHLLPFGKTWFEKLVKEGRAPQKIKLGNRCTFYRNSEILEFLADIVNYRAEEFSSGRVRGG